MTGNIRWYKRHVQDNIDFLTKGYGFKKRYLTQKCKCFHCSGPGCCCQNCLNGSFAYCNIEGDTSD